MNSYLLHSLTPGQRYYYVYGDYYGWSSEKSFKAAPRSDKDVTSNVIAFGGQSILTMSALTNKLSTAAFVFADMGCAEEDGSVFLLNNIQPDSFNTTHMILKQMDRGSVDFVLHLGDISYARGFSSVVSYWPE